MKDLRGDQIAVLEARLAALERRLNGGEVAVRELALVDAEGRARGVLAVDDEAFDLFARLQADPVDVAALVLLDHAGAARLALHCGRGGTAGLATLKEESGEFHTAAGEQWPLVIEAEQDRIAKAETARAVAVDQHTEQLKATRAKLEERAKRPWEERKAAIETAQKEDEARRQRRQDERERRRAQRRAGDNPEDS